MRPNDATVFDWQDLVDEYKAKKKPVYPLAMRMENSHLSVARHAGHYLLNGHVYIVVTPWKSMRVEDGRALLGVEEKFHTWACKKLKNKDKVLIRNEVQDELGFGL